MKKVSYIFILFVIIIISCKEKKEPQKKSIAINEKIDINSYSGEYDPALVLKYDAKSKLLKGSLNYITTSSCKLEFIGDCNELSNDTLLVKIKGFSIDSTIVGNLVLKNEAVSLQVNNPPAFCQRIIDLSKGEVFYKK